MAPSSSSEAENPTLDDSTYLAQAETHIINNNFLEALTSLRSAQPSIKQQSSDEFSTTSDAHRYMQLQALCRIELAFASKTSNSLETWWHVFGLENTDPSSSIATCKTTTTTTAAATTAKDIKRHYKRLAFLIHPDKCSLPCAPDTFKKLQQGMEALIESLECSERARKKAKQSEGNGEEEEEEKEFAWWSTWDNPYADGISSDATAEGQEAQLKKEEEEKDNALLSALSSRELAKEVQGRQDAMLSRLLPGCTMHDMKTTLLRARKMLHAKLEEEKEVKANKLDDGGGGGGGGGFLFL
jgi:hypothetical protein